MSEPAKDEDELAHRVADTLREYVPHINFHGEAIRALAAIRAAGWAVVPVDPTEEIQDAIINAMDDAGYFTANEHEASTVYQAAIKAAAPGVRP